MRRRFVKVREFLARLWQLIRHGRDDCVFCLGRKGGMPGNENLVWARTKYYPVCDYCSAIVRDIDNY